VFLDYLRFGTADARHSRQPSSLKSPLRSTSKQQSFLGGISGITKWNWLSSGDISWSLQLMVSGSASTTVAARRWVDVVAGTQAPNSRRNRWLSERKEETQCGNTPLNLSLNYLTSHHQLAHLALLSSIHTSTFGAQPLSA